jgi:endogenous inhibitor of DNA gyrase (YacG/DUF329 family)
MDFPPLYECSTCGKPVSVTPVNDGEPIIKRSCEHDTAIWANRKVTLRGKGTLDAMNPVSRGALKLTMTVRQFLCGLTGRSI